MKSGARPFWIKVKFDKAANDQLHGLAVKRGISIAILINQIVIYALKSALEANDA